MSKRNHKDAFPNDQIERPSQIVRTNNELNNDIGSSLNGQDREQITLMILDNIKDGKVQETDRLLKLNPWFMNEYFTSNLDPVDEVSLPCPIMNSYVICESTSASIDMIRVLMKHGAPIDEGKGEVETPLEYLIMNLNCNDILKNKELLEFLLKEGKYSQETANQIFKALSSDNYNLAYSHLLFGQTEKLNLELITRHNYLKNQFKTLPNLSDLSSQSLQIKDEINNNLPNLISVDYEGILQNIGLLEFFFKSGKYSHYANDNIRKAVAKNDNGLVNLYLKYGYLERLNKELTELNKELTSQLETSSNLIALPDPLLLTEQHDESSQTDIDEAILSENELVKEKVHSLRPIKQEDNNPSINSFEIMPVKNALDTEYYFNSGNHIEQTDTEVVGRLTDISNDGSNDL